MNELDQAAKLARLKDDAARRDPTSTDEQRDAAKEDRQRTGAAAVAADPVLSARLEQLGREHDAQSSRVPRAEATPQPMSTRNPIKGAEVGKATFLKVPYREKNEAKALGAKWDRQEQAWYVPTGVDPTVFARWSQATPVEKTLKDQGAEILAAPPHELRDRSRTDDDIHSRDRRRQQDLIDAVHPGGWDKALCQRHLQRRLLSRGRRARRVGQDTEPDNYLACFYTSAASRRRPRAFHRPVCCRKGTKYTWGVHLHPAVETRQIARLLPRGGLTRD